MFCNPWIFLKTINSSSCLSCSAEISSAFKPIDSFHLRLRCPRGKPDEVAEADAKQITGGALKNASSGGGPDSFAWAFPEALFRAFPETLCGAASGSGGGFVKLVNHRSSGPFPDPCQQRLPERLARL